MLARLRRCGQRVTEAALRRDQRAVTAIEYALIAGVMVVALVVSVPAIGTSLASIFGSVSSHL